MRASASTKQLVSGVCVSLLLFLAGNAGAQTEPVYAGWTVGEPWDGHGTILRSTDSGETWVLQGDGQIAPVKMNGVFAVDPFTAWVVGHSDGGYGTIYHTVDGGDTWGRKGSPECVPDTEFQKVHASGEDVWVVGTGAILHSADGGETWKNRIPEGYENTHLQGVYTHGGNTVWATGGPDAEDRDVILNSTDSGLTWIRQTGDYANEEHPPLYFLGFSAATKDTAWAVGNAYTIVKTTDGGESWTRQDGQGVVGGLGDLNEVYAVDTSTVWVAADSVIFWTTDGGEHWDSSHGKTSGSIAFMGISAVSAKHVWASYAGTDGYIEYTTDGGETWTQVYPMGAENNPGLWTVSFAIQPVNPEALALTVGPGRQYQTIQSAVVVARGGDTIFVYPGIYEESVLVTTNNLKIIAVGDDVTVFSPTEMVAAVTVYANGVTIRGFNELTGAPCTPGIKFEGSYNTFSKNIINPGSCPGINALTCRDPDGGSNFNRIENNTIMHADLGIVMTSTSADVLNVGNIIRNNTINQISATGIAVQNGLIFTISGNIIPGSAFGHCISVAGTNNVDQGAHRITDNQLTNCQGYGIALWADDRTSLINNRIAGNEVSFSDHGINLYADPDAMVRYSLIMGNTVFHNQYGIVLEPGADGNILYMNYVVTHFYDGIQVNGDWNMIISNIATGNGPYDLADWGTKNGWFFNVYETASWQ